jgi:hypothetical protein
MGGVTAAGRVSVFDVLYALCLVRVWEPVLAHVEVVAETASGACHEYLGDREGRHECGGGGCGWGWGCGGAVRKWCISRELRKLQSIAVIVASEVGLKAQKS